MRNSIWNARIPTLLGLFLIIVGLTLTSSLVKNGTIIIGRASPSQAPKEIRITNISDKSFVVSYKTDDSLNGSLMFGNTKSLGQLIPDDRDQLGNSYTHKLHYFTVKNLQPKTTYYFSIISGTETFSKSDQPFDVITLNQPIAVDTASSLSGKVIAQDGPPQEAIVFLKNEKSQTISVFVNQDGSYVLQSIPLAIKDSNSSFVLQLLIISDSQNASAKILSSIQNTIPTITLGESYDFTLGATPIDLGKASSNSAELGFASLNIQQPVKNTEILVPKKDESFSDPKPLFKGTAAPGSTVAITIRSDEAVNARVKANTNGTWVFRPSTPLTPGAHTISISAIDASGILKTITRTFIVQAEGSSFTEPSVSPIATPTLTPSPFPTTSIQPTSSVIPTPTSFVVPTNIPTPTEIPTLVPTRPQPSISPPGSSSLITTALSALFIITAAVGLFFLTLGGSAS